MNRVDIVGADHDAAKKTMGVQSPKSIETESFGFHEGGHLFPIESNQCGSRSSRLIAGGCYEIA